MDAEKITMYRPLEDKSGAVKQFPATVSSQVFDEESGQTVAQQVGDVAAQADLNTVDLDGRGLNASKYGAVGTGEISDSSAIQKGIDDLSLKGGGTLVLTGKHLITETIYLKSGVSLKFENESELIVSSNIKVISFDRNTSVYGKLKVSVTIASYAEDVLYFDGSKALSFRDIVIDDVFIIGDRHNGQGNAIRLDCTKVGSNISFLNFGHGVIRGFNKGIFLDVPNLNSTTAYNYANSNRFNNFEISDCTYNVYLSGGKETNNECAGNHFPNMSLQWNSRNVELLHCEGAHNMFGGILWDAGSRGIKAFNFTERSAANYAHINKFYPNDYSDNGTGNFISFRDYSLYRYEDKLPIKNRLDPTIITKRIPTYGRFNGEFEDILHGADKIHNVSIVEGATYIAGGLASLSNVFDGKTSKYATLLLNPDRVFKFKIEFNTSNYYKYTDPFMTGGLSKLAIIFQSARLPKNVAVEITSSNDVITQLMPRIDDSGQAYILDLSDVGMAVAIKSIAITLTGGNEADVRLSRIVAKSLHVGGNRYLSNTGDYVAGDLNFLTNSYGVVMKSPNGTRYRLGVSDDGSPTFTPVT